LALGGIEDSILVINDECHAGTPDAPLNNIPRNISDVCTGP
jgi:hypothetical protein